MVFGVLCFFFKFFGLRVVFFCEIEIIMFIWFIIVRNKDYKENLLFFQEVIQEVRYFIFYFVLKKIF